MPVCFLVVNDYLHCITRSVGLREVVAICHLLVVIVNVPGVVDAVIEFVVVLLHWDRICGYYFCSLFLEKECIAEKCCFCFKLRYKLKRNLFSR